jgi:hypothetical protein
MACAMHLSLMMQCTSACMQVGSYLRDRGPRCESFDGVCHAPTPAGGRTNLRNLVGCVFVCWSGSRKPLKPVGCVCVCVCVYASFNLYIAGFHVLFFAINCAYQLYTAITVHTSNIGHIRPKQCIQFLQCIYGHNCAYQ